MDFLEALMAGLMGMWKSLLLSFQRLPVLLLDMLNPTSRYVNTRFYKTLDTAVLSTVAGVKIVFLSLAVT